MEKRRRILAATSVVVFSSALVANAPAASAESRVAADATKCPPGEENYKRFRLPRKTDIKMLADPCITRYDSGSMTATVRLHWNEESIPAVGSGHKFDKFDVHVTLERRPNGGSTDTVVGSRTCDLSGKVNRYWSGQDACGFNMPGVYNSAYDWSADGFIVYNIDNDGEGDKTWQLYGSPLIK